MGFYLCGWTATLRLEAIIKRGIRTGLCSPDIPTLTEMTESIDDALFQHIMYNPYHVIHHLLPARRELVYNIRQRHHDRQLTLILISCVTFSFIHRMLFKDCYWLDHIWRLRYVIQWLLSVSIDFYHRCFNRFVLCRCVLSYSVTNKRIWWWWWWWQTIFRQKFVVYAMHP